jgi:hypothetical protein
MDFGFRLITAEDRPFMVQMLYEATIASEQTFDIDNIENFPHSYAYIENFLKRARWVLLRNHRWNQAGAAWLRNFRGRLTWGFRVLS